MAPMKVYGWAVSPWMARVLVCLEEAGAEYELVPMSRCGGDHRRPEHLVRNPFGEIPVLEDGDLTLYQSRAIARYIFRKYKPEFLREGNLEESTMVDVWVDVEAHQHQPVTQPIVWHCIIHQYVGRARDQKLVDENVEKLKKLLEVYEARLSASRYLAGDFISLADLSHFPFMRYFMATEYAGVVDAYPHVKAWWDAILARPSVKKVMAGMPPDFGYASGNIPRLIFTSSGIDLHFVWERVAAGAVRVLHVPTSSQFADLFTKGLPSSVFVEFRSSINVRCTDVRTAGGCSTG